MDGKTDRSTRPSKRMFCSSFESDNAKTFTKRLSNNQAASASVFHFGKGFRHPFNDSQHDLKLKTSAFAQTFHNSIVLTQVVYVSCENIFDRMLKEPDHLTGLGYPFTAISCCRGLVSLWKSLEC